MTISKARARRIAKRILRENRKGRSYRTLAREDYPGVKAGTLNRFAKEKGDYIPADESILIALGLKKTRKPHMPTPEQIRIKSMADETREALKWKRKA